MELEKQVVSLELAKRLKELGVKQASYFYWWSTGYSGEGGLLGSPREARAHEDREAFDAPGANSCYDPISAFTVAELGELLKCTFHVDQPTKIGMVKMGEREWHTWINHPDKKLQSFNGSEADARAKMLIYLIENKLISLSSKESGE